MNNNSFPKPNINIDKLNREFDIGNDRLDFYRFDKNERTYNFSKRFFSKLSKEINTESLTMYPDQKPLYDILSKNLKIQSSNILLTPGADAGIKYFFDTYITKNTKVAYLWPTYAMIDVYSQMYEAKSIKISFDTDLQIDIENLLNKLNNEIDVLIIANPNQPSGTIIDDKDLLRLFEKCKEKQIPFLMDQTYYDFTNANKIEIEKYIIENPFLFAVRSFSKSYGIAGARLGYIVSNENNIKNLYKVKPLSDINYFSLKCAELLLTDKTFFKEHVAEILESKKILEQYLIKNDIDFVPSHTNFMHIKIDDEITLTDIYNKLVGKNFLVRKTGDNLPATLVGCIRLTIGSIDQTKKFISEFNTIKNA